jgi:hypothetical protein
VLLPNECLLLLFISLSTQSGNFWIHPRMPRNRFVTLSSVVMNTDFCDSFCLVPTTVCMVLKWYLNTTISSTGFLIGVYFKDFILIIIQAHFLICLTCSYMTFRKMAPLPFSGEYFTFSIIFSVRRSIQKFPDWPSGARTANDSTLYH